MRLVVFFFLLFAKCATSQGQLVQDADKALAAKNYAQALKLYRQIDSMGYGSQALFANMAIASASLHQHANVVLYLEKAKKYKPTSQEVLALAEQLLPENNAFSEDEGTYERIANRCTGFLSDDSWTWCSIFFIALLLAFIVIRMVLPRIALYSLPRVRQWQFLLLSMATLYCLFASRYRHNQIFDNQNLIITSSHCVLKMGPDSQSPDLMQLEAGTKVELEESLGEWREVETMQGDKGWIMVSSAMRI